MRHHRRGLELAGLEPDRGPVEVVEQPLTAAEQGRHDMDGELVDEIRAQVLLRGRGAAADRDVLAARRSRALSMPPMTKWKVVPPSISSGAARGG